MTAIMKNSQAENNAPQEAHMLRVTGRVKQPLVLCLKDLCGMDVEEVVDLPIICGSGTPKGRLSSGRGVLLEDVIRRAEVIKDEDNDTKKMFIIATAVDGYKVVFSWQEIFNTDIGEGVMILIEKEGKSVCHDQSLPDLISVQDYFTGARYVKGLESIEVALAG